MRFSVRISRTVQDTIASWMRPPWGLSRALVIAIYNRLLSDLPAAPDALLGERIVPLKAQIYAFNLEDDRAIPRLIRFAFAVTRDDSTRVLSVAIARMTIEDSGLN